MLRCRGETAGVAEKLAFSACVVSIQITRPRTNRFSRQHEPGLYVCVHHAVHYPRLWETSSRTLLVVFCSRFFCHFFPLVRNAVTVQQNCIAPGYPLCLQRLCCQVYRVYSKAVPSRYEGHRRKEPGRGQLSGRKRRMFLPSRHSATCPETASKAPTEKPQSFTG